MQRLFFAFPAGLPGVGLLLLRVAISLTSLYEAHILLNPPAVHASAFVALRLAVFIAAAAVLVGLTTPIAGLSTGIGAVAALLLTGSPWLGFNQNEVVLLNLMMMAFVIAAVGPGAFSVDARLFGRREIRFPD